MATAKDVLAEARKHIGYKESPANSNRTKFGEWYGLNGQPWCAIFVSYVLEKAGVKGYRHSYTPTGVEMFKQRGRWHTSNPKPGDVVYFDFPDSVTRVQHVGFVESIRADGTLVTIEGNTSAGNTGSQDNGGGVFRRIRPRAYCVGFGRPPYEVEVKVVARKRVVKKVPRSKVKALIEKLRRLGFKILKRKRL